MRLVLMGSPALAVPGFEALVAAGHRIVAVYTQPDKPVGRKKVITPCPVAAWAREQGYPVEQPPTFRKRSARDTLGELAPDALVVTAYGRILPRGVLRIPRLGAVNLHASLLPRWRGASPIQAAIRAGDAETGLTTMLMDEGLDTGPMLLTERFPLPPDWDSPRLAEEMAARSGPLLARTLAGLADGSVTPVPQPDTGITHAPILSRTDGELSWTDPAADIERTLRAFRPWPGVTLPLPDGRLKILRADVTESSPDAAPAQVLAVETQHLTVACSAGALALHEVQAPGKRAMNAAAWARGLRLAPGDLLTGS